MFDPREIPTKQGIAPAILLAIGSIWLSIQEQLIQNLFWKVFTPEGFYLMPYILFGIGLIWILYLACRDPRIEIVFQPTHEPYKHEWTDHANNHHILFRIEIRNSNRFKSIGRAYVIATSLEPFTTPITPMRLRQMNEPDTEKEFWLPPGGSKYIDVFEQTEGKNIDLWHIVRSYPTNIEPKDYTITICAYGHNVSPVSKTFKYTKEGTVWVMKQNS